MKEIIFSKYNLDKAASIKTVQHRDTMRLDGCGRKMKKTDEGYLSGSAPIAKVGIMSYLMADGTIVREFVPPETLFNKDSMASLRLKPVTNNHPEERKVTVDNAGYRQVGFVGETIESEADIFLCANMVITDAYAVAAIDGGKQELSPGYEAELVFQPGVFNNEQYDAIQVSRKYNHVAVVYNARGGTSIRMNCDGFELNLNKEKNMLVKYKIDNVEYEASQEIVNLITKKDETIAAEKNLVKTANDSLQAMTAERDTLKVKVDALEKRDIQKEVNDAVKSRLELERVAAVVLDKVDEAIDNRGLKIAIIAKKLPTIAEKIDDKTSEVYIDAVLDTVKAAFTKEENDSIASQRKIVTNKDEKPEVKNDEVAARQKMINAQKEAYKLK